jgi:hypothetical protein
MGKSNYSYLREPLLKRDKVCRACYEDRSWELVIHHKTYARVGNELLSDVVLLCANCHNNLHLLCKGNDPDLASFTERFIQAKGMMWGEKRIKERKKTRRQYNKQQRKNEHLQELLYLEIASHI